MSKKFVDKVATSAILDFITYMSASDQPLSISRNHEIPAALNRVKEFLELRDCAKAYDDGDPDYWRFLNPERKHNKKKNKRRK